MTSSPRVVFFHGLESGLGGGKHRFLQANYDDVGCADMSMSLWNPFKSNSIMRNVLMYAWRTAPWNVSKFCMKASLDGSLAAQAAELQTTRARGGGVVVASSWGGAVATLALARGEWEGPTVLICPAYNTVIGRAGAYDPSYDTDAVYASIAQRLSGDSEEAVARRRQLVIVHGTADDVVPIDDSRAFAAATGIELIEVDGADHRMRCLLEGDAPQLKSLIDRVHSAAASSGLPAMAPSATSTN